MTDLNADELTFVAACDAYDYSRNQLHALIRTGKVEGRLVEVPGTRFQLRVVNRASLEAYRARRWQRGGELAVAA